MFTDSLALVPDLSAHHDIDAAVVERDLFLPADIECFDVGTGVIVLVAEGWSASFRSVRDLNHALFCALRRDRCSSISFSKPSASTVSRVRAPSVGSDRAENPAHRRAEMRTPRKMTRLWFEPEVQARDFRFKRERDAFIKRSVEEFFFSQGASAI